MAAHTSRIMHMAFCALFCALIVICAQIIIPMPLGVPISLATFAVYLAGALQKGVWGAMSAIVYAALGAVGVPVFAGLVGGPGVLFGRTGGYILGYIACAAVIGLGRRLWGEGYFKLCAYMAAGTVALYAFGTAWYMVLADVSLGASLMACVAPFLPGDVVKIALAALLAERLRQPLARMLA